MQQFFIWKRTGPPGPGHLLFEQWPETREYQRLYTTNFVYQNGQNASLYSSWDDQTIDTHLKWCQQYGIDTVAVQVKWIAIYFNMRSNVVSIHWIGHVVHWNVATVAVKFIELNQKRYKNLKIGIGLSCKFKPIFNFFIINSSFSLLIFYYLFNFSVLDHVTKQFCNLKTTLQSKWRMQLRNTVASFI